MPFRTRLRCKDKTTHRTWIAHWPIESGIVLCALTGSRRLITLRGGYSEYNDRGEPVLDSWIDAIDLFGPNERQREQAQNIQNAAPEFGIIFSRGS
jgi:hypothetical protein